jgi:hypothetical protein
MPITLEQAKVGMTDKVDQSVIDMFQRSSLLLDKLTFDDSISPGTGGSTLGYSYVQLLTPSQAGIRSINSEYVAGEATRVEKNSKAVIMGGSFQVDRVLQNTSGAIDEMSFQAEQKIKATRNYFHHLVINGSSAKTGSGYETNTFDGLRKLLSGTQNEFTSDTSLTTAAELDENGNAFVDEVDKLVSSIDGNCDMLLMNNVMLLKLRSVARRIGYYDRTKDDFGRYVESFAGVPMVDMGKYYNGTKSIDVVDTTAATADTKGLTSIYAVSFGLDAFHGISPSGGKIIHTYMPDMNQPGAVKTGEVELVAGVVLKNTLKAAALNNIPILPTI